MTPLIIDSILGKPINEVPVWCMRQAGRYLPEYQALRKRHSFNQLAETPDLATEITLQPIRRFSELDAAILFADILTPSRALGFDFEFSPGPVLKNPIKTSDQIESLEFIPLKDSVPFVFKALNQVRNEIESEGRVKRRAVLGFAASPWTLACYLIHQGIYKQHIGTKVFANKFPEQFELLLDKLTNLTIDYLAEKHNSGADAVQVFDTWGNLLSNEEYSTLSGKWIRKIITDLKSRNIPVIVYTSGGTQHLSEIIDMAPDAISLDWRMELSQFEKLIPDNITIQGNIDPSFLFASVERIESLTTKTYSSHKRRTSIIANLGHGILPETPIDGMKAFLRGVKKTYLSSK